MIARSTEGQFPRPTVQNRANRVCAFVVWRGISKTMSARNIKILLGCSVVIILVCVYTFIDPSQYMWMPKCPFYILTGFKCPGCGTQRALYAFLHGRFVDCIKFNPILIPAIVYMVLLLLSKTKSYYNLLTGKTACNTLLVVIIAYWILRNIFNI